MLKIQRITVSILYYVNKYGNIKETTLNLFLQVFFLLGFRQLL